MLKVNHHLFVRIDVCVCECIRIPLSHVQMKRELHEMIQSNHNCNGSEMKTQQKIMWIPIGIIACIKRNTKSYVENKNCAQIERTNKKRKKE